MIRDRKLEPNESQTPPAPAKRMTRETKLGLLVAATFIVLTCGVMIVKSRYKPVAPADEPQTIAQIPAPNPSPTRSEGIPSRTTPSPTRSEGIAPIIERPAAAVPQIIPDLIIPDFDPSQQPPIVVPTSGLEIPTIPDAPEPTPSVVPPDDKPIVIPGSPIPPKNTELILPPPSDFVGPIMPPTEPTKDVFSKEPKIKMNLDPIDSPPPIDLRLPVEQVKPEAKRPIIRIGEPKNDSPPPIEPLVITPSVKKDAPMVIEPLLIDPPVKKSPPAILIDINPKKEAPIATGLSKKDGDYDEDLHSVKPNETYHSISKQYYNSEAYAIALQRYNKDRPSQAAYVRIPPIWVLEKKYAADVTGSPARAVNYVPPAATEPAVRNDPTYTVADNGENLGEIAKKTLGDKELWKRIYDLNPQINPTESIPGGTRLRMPQ